MKLYNTASRTVDPIDNEDELHKALLAGTHAFEAGSAINVTSPDGIFGTVPAEKAAEAVKAGYRVETPSQAAVREYVRDNQGMKGALKVGLGQLADEALLGLPELVYDHKGDPLEVAKKEALKKEHELANTLGGITGFGGSLVYGGPLWEGAAKVGEKVAAHVAEKLAVTAGEEVGKRTIAAAAKDVVKRMAAKGVGAGAEGAVVSMPHAVTEAALGDPDDAAETLLAGVGVGALLGGGGVLARDFAKLTKETVIKGAGLVTQQQETAKTLARKAAKVLTGVGEDDILHYIENADRVNAAPAREVLKDTLDAAVSRKSAMVDAAKENVAVARKELDDAYHAARFDLAREQAPETLGRSVMGALENEKSVLGSLSEQADDALERSGRSFRRDDLLAFLDDVGGSIGVRGANGEAILVSDEAVGAAAKLAAQRDRIASFGDELDAVQLRGVLRDIRRDIKWNTMAGEFNDTLNKARKTFSERISSVLKDQVPEYAGYMQRMSQLSESLEKMVPLFGDEKRAVGTLNSLMTPRGKVNEAVLARFGELTGQDFVGELARFQESKRLLELSRRQDMREALVPELHQKAQRVEAELARAEADFEPIKRLSQERTQNIIRQQAFKNASIEDRRALEALSQSEGQDFLTMIKDRNVLDAFGKESTNGSRKTLLGAILGGMVSGGPMGSALGAAAGATADVYGGALLKRLLDANRSVAGVLFSEKAMKAAAEKLDEIPSLLGRMAGRVKPARQRGKASYAITRLLTGTPEDRLGEEEARPAQRLKRLEELGGKAAVLVSNPAHQAEAIASLTTPLSQGGAPGIAASLGRKASTAVTYLHSVMPRPPRPRSPFAREVTWRPPDYELAAYEDKVQVAVDPFSVLAELEHGTLTRAHVESLRTIYPGLYRIIGERVQAAVVSGVQPMDYAQRAKLSLLLGVPMDTSLEAGAISYYQQAYEATAEAEAQAASSAPAPAAGGFKAKVNTASGATDADRVAGRRS